MASAAAVHAAARGGSGASCFWHGAAVPPYAREVPTLNNPLMPPSLRQATGPVFHYTTAEGLIGIVEGGCLWASEASSLNDLAEVRRGWDIIREWLNSRRATADAADRLADAAEDPLQDAHEVFVLSGSIAPDDANQWRLYAQSGHGYAVELDSGVDLTAVSDAEPPTARPRSGLFSLLEFDAVVTVTPWYHVLYNRAETERALLELEVLYDEAIDRASGAAANQEEFGVAMSELQGEAAEALATVAHLVKAEGFSGEREVRVVTTYLMANQHIRYRPGANGVVGYGVLTTAPSGHLSRRVLHSPRVGTRRRPADPLPVNSVRLAPLLQDEHLSTVRRLLAKNDLPHATVVKSDVQLR